MTQYVAFLRAINVTNRYVKMARLAELFVEIGFENVETFIASGNVVFETDTDADLEAMIEARLLAGLEFEVDTMVRDVTRLREIRDHSPFEAGDGETVFVGFLKAEPSDEVQDSIMAFETESDTFGFWESHFYWLCEGPSHKSKFDNKKLERKLKSPSTLRNINTLDRLLEKYS